MTAIETPHEAASSLAAIVKRITAALEALAALSLTRLSTSAVQTTHRSTLDERLLRDVGVSVGDADIARLRARMGVAQTDDLDAIAGGGQSAGQFMRSIKRECYRSDL
jgi:hypothetical protein